MAHFVNILTLILHTWVVTKFRTYCEKYLLYVRQICMKLNFE